MSAHLSAILALLLGQAAPGAQQCLQPSEVGDLAVIAMPELIDSFARSCGPHLPEPAFLRTGAAQLSQRLRAEGAPHREPAFAAIRRMAPPNFRNVDPQVGLGAVIGGFTGGMTRNLNPKSCGELSRFVESLAPLPTPNIAQMVSSAVAFGMAMRPAGQKGGPPICAS